MSQTNAIYEEAMDVAELGLEAEREGQHAIAAEYNTKALQILLDAVRDVRDRFDFEPTRSLVYFSAANLAFELEDYERCEHLSYEALGGSPPPNVEADFKQLLDEVRMYVNLRRDNLTFEPGELNVGLEGAAVLRGYVSTEEFIKRVNTAQKLYRRTLERQRGIEYRDRGGPAVGTAGLARSYMSLTQPGSYRVTLRFGVQTEFEGMSEPQAVIDEMLDCLQVLQNSGPQTLRDRIKEPAYYRNFLGLAKQIAPDGKQVSAVALSTSDSKKLRTVLVRKDVVPSGSLAITELSDANDSESPLKVTVFQGRLNSAVDKGNSERKVGLTDREGNDYEFVVPTGMMRDIVRPFFDEMVEIQAVRQGKELVLEGINSLVTDEPSSNQA